MGPVKNINLSGPPSAIYKTPSGPYRHIHRTDKRKLFSSHHQVFEPAPNRFFYLHIFITGDILNKKYARLCPGGRPKQIGQIVLRSIRETAMVSPKGIKTDNSSPPIACTRRESSLKKILAAKNAFGELKRHSGYHDHCPGNILFETHNPSPETNR